MHSNRAVFRPGEPMSAVHSPRRCGTGAERGRTRPGKPGGAGQARSRARVLWLALLAAAPGCERAGNDAPGSDHADAGPAPTPPTSVVLGVEVAVAEHLADGDEFALPIERLIAHGRHLFGASWTVQEGGGRPYTRGTGAPLLDPAAPLQFPRNVNRISGPDANACAGCHNAPFGIAGGGGDFVTSVFVLAQRYDHVTFDPADSRPLGGTVDERGISADLNTIANSRATPGLFGAGFIEMLARQITAELRALRDQLGPGSERVLAAKGISFGRLSRRADGTWDTTAVEGLPAPSLASTGADDPPSLIIRPFHQAGAVVSLRQFTNNAFNHHHGIQSAERFGINTDPDGDGFANELTRADVTAVSVFQATLPVPGRVIPRHPDIEDAVWTGEIAFADIGCARCHIPALALDNRGWVYSEPNPYNPVGNLQLGATPVLRVDLTRADLPGPRLRAEDGTVWVPAYTDFKLHDITTGPGDPHGEPLDMLQPSGSEGFFAGNRRFMTKRLWGAANEPPYFHHGKLTTMRQAILAHAGAAQEVTDRFRSLSPYEQDAIIEFLKTLQVLPPGSRYRVVDERGHPRSWPPYQDD